MDKCCKHERHHHHYQSGEYAITWWVICDYAKSSDMKYPLSSPEGKECDCKGYYEFDRKRIYQ
jgi:hypothetical protein